MSCTIFSLPVPVYRQPKVPSENGSCARKRKRTKIAGNDDNKSIDAFSETDQLRQVHGSHFSEYSAVLTPHERSQYRIAGQPFDQSPPTKPFPHASPPKLRDTSSTKHSTTHLLANLHPPMYAPSSDSKNLHLHQQHLGALTALLHRTLCEGDFARAGRTLGLILRDEVGGLPLDIRAEGRWGIGAEILLRQGTRLGHNEHASSSGKENEVNKRSTSEQDPTVWFTRNGFEEVRKYYERLIVQYPFHKANPGAVNALDFYPAMFGLWIYVVQEESKLSRESLDESTLSETSHAEDSTLSETTQPFNLSLKQRTLAQAREIAIRMDDCMTTIPYSDDIELIRLRGMVAWWVADLIDDILENQNRHYEGNEDDLIQANVVAAALTSRSQLQGPIDDVNAALRLEAARARERSLEMQRKIQRQRNGPR